MDDWLARYAAALAHGLPEDAPSVDLGPGGDEAVEELARLVARGTHERNGPLSAFLVGLYVAMKAASGMDARAAFEEALRVARCILPADPDA